jgi:hypothetical protein
MLDDDQAVVSLLKDSHELERREASPDYQRCEPFMEPT